MNVRTYVSLAAGYLRFGFLRWPQLATYRTYRPDSDFVFRAFGSLGPLRRAWEAGNARNNRGDLPRFYSLLLNLAQIESGDVPGDFAELGVYRGNSAALLAAVAARSQRSLILYDTFAGFDKRDLRGEDADRAVQFRETSMARVARTIGGDGRAVFVRGYFPDSITPQCRERKFAFVHIDCDLYEPARAALEFFYPRLSPGGTIVVHDYSSGFWPGIARAVDEFAAVTGEMPVLLPDKSGSAVFRKRRATRAIA